MGPREILIILVIVLLLFGAPKLPQLARSLGQSLRILKDETKSLTDDGAQDKETGPASKDGAGPDGGTENDKPATSSSDDPRDREK